jgi:hypothetical protein
MAGIPTPSRVGPVTVPGVNHGNQVAAHAAVHAGIEAFQKALPQIPMGSELHTELLTTIKKLSSLLSDSSPDPAQQIQQLVQLARQTQQEGPMAALGRMYPQQQQSPAMPAPATPTPQAA